MCISCESDDRLIRTCARGSLSPLKGRGTKYTLSDFSRNTQKFAPIIIRVKAPINNSSCMTSRIIIDGGGLLDPENAASPPFPEVKATIPRLSMKINFRNAMSPSKPPEIRYIQGLELRRILRFNPNIATRRMKPNSSVKPITGTNTLSPLPITF
ncbi:MAG: hypothetical protein M1518_02285 [Candidatus Thermoplasmatota archaeon]|jgi:hypothetical protein|nr:hypothetical protein [Candidatus Thermoplasmatota archaeon]